MSKLYQSNFYKINRRQFIKYGAMALGTGILAACTNDQKTSSGSSPFASSPAVFGKLDKVTLQTEWFAEGEHGGFYQAVATGIYKDHGLDVTIKPGSPTTNNNLLLMLGVADFIIGYATDAINAVAGKVPKVTVAAPFQTSPLGLIAHPDTGNDSLESLVGKPLYISSHANVTYYPFLKKKYGYTDNQKRSRSIDDFLADKNGAIQCYVTAEPFIIQRQGGFTPVVIPLVDSGYNPYISTIETTTKLVETNPNLVQRFVDASIRGWYSYLDNPEPGNALIKEDNPDMTDEFLAYCFKKIKQYNIVLNDEAKAKGIGIMTDQRWKQFFNQMVEAGVFKSDIPYQDAYTLKFVNKGVKYYKSEKS